MRLKINLDTQSAVLDMVKVATTIEEPVYITNADRSLIVSAKSLLGTRYASLEWYDLFVECEKDIYLDIIPFLAE
ncbi:MAG: hypothetical protein J6R47_01875 [Acholeplasmatales bacterium]|nr:hypothetical protein [Acholeplasmatales bacterium]